MSPLLRFTIAANSASSVAIAMLTLMALAQPVHSQSAAMAWPEVPVPPAAQRFSVMPLASINGRLTRTEGYFSELAPHRLTDWYQTPSRGHWIRNQLGPQTVLSQWRAPFLITVQIQPSDGGSKVLVATTALPPPAPWKAPFDGQGDDLLGSLPGEPRLLQTFSTADPGQSATTYVLQTTGGAQAAIQAAGQWLFARGYRLQAKGSDAQGAQMLQFTGERREAVVVATRQADGSHHLLITLIRYTP